jgi:hypothetical protein
MRPTEPPDVRRAHPRMRVTSDNRKATGRRPGGLSVRHALPGSGAAPRGGRPATVRHNVPARNHGLATSASRRPKVGELRHVPLNRAARCRHRYLPTRRVNRAVRHEHPLRQVVARTRGPRARTPCGHLDLLVIRSAEPEDLMRSSGCQVRPTSAVRHTHPGQSGTADKRVAIAAIGKHRARTWSSQPQA